MDLVSAPKSRRRQQQRKVRTGCITCKARHVKCDETRPTCKRCEKFAVECGGYYITIPPRLKLATTLMKRPKASKLAPKIDPISEVQALFGPQSARPCNTDAHSPPVLHRPYCQAFNSDQEYRYFCHFREKTVFGLVTYFKVSLWDRLILQACESSPPIRHAIIALGALDLTMHSAQYRELLSPIDLGGDQSPAASHHRFALLQYGKAIKSMSDTLSIGRQDIRTALIVCLLTICFESLNGDIQSATAQVRNGLKLLREWRTSMPMVQSALELDGDSTMDLARSELVHAFTRLNNDTVLLMDEVPIETNISLKPYAKDSLQSLPIIFETLEEARIHWEFVLGKMLHWIASAYAWGSRSADYFRARPVLPRPSEDYTSLPISNLTSFAEQRQTYLAAFRRWHTAFKPLLHRSRTHEGNSDFVAAIALELRWKSLITTLGADHFQGETCYDAHIIQFEEVLDLAETLVELESKTANSSKPQYTFDGSLIISVYGVTLKCRDPVLRRRAISLLQSRSRREGVVDSALSARVATIQMEIEEAGAIGNYIPEEARIRAIKTTHDMMKRMGHMKYLKLVQGRKGEFHQHELDFTW